MNDEIRRFKRLEDWERIQSREKLVSQTTGTRNSDTISQNSPLDDIQIRRDEEFRIDQPQKYYVKGKIGVI